VDDRREPHTVHVLSYVLTTPISHARAPKSRPHVHVPIATRVQPGLI
jgi:hypothetical protein